MMDREAGAEETHTQDPVAGRDAGTVPLYLHEILLQRNGDGPGKPPGPGAGRAPQRSQTRTGSPTAVSGLVKRLMAIERARFLGTDAVDLERYAARKRAQRWKEATGLKK